MERRSPRLGARPPEKAVVLFDGTGLEAWMQRDGQPAGWKLREDGSMEVTRGNILTRRSFGDVRIHLEFRTPLMPEARGQARGNSGVYVQGRYEVQVLDSFGLEPMDNGCGAVYRIAPPRVNASLPPLQWQTYEITFRAPRFDSSGSKTANARITVRHNGEVIHSNLELPGSPRGVSATKRANADRCSCRTTATPCNTGMSGSCPWIDSEERVTVERGSCRIGWGRGRNPPGAGSRPAAGAAESPRSRHTERS